MLLSQFALGRGTARTKLTKEVKYRPTNSKMRASPCFAKDDDWARLRENNPKAKAPK